LFPNRPKVNLKLVGDGKREWSKKKKTTRNMISDKFSTVADEYFSIFSIQSGTEVLNELRANEHGLQNV